MRTSTLIRWGGLAALLAGAIGIVGEIALYVTTGGLPRSEAGVTAAWSAFTALMALSTMLAVLGLVAIYARQAGVMGKLGMVAFALAMIGAVMTFAHQWTGTFVIPVLAQEAPDLLDAITADTTTILAGGVFLSMILLPLGWFLLGLSSLKAKVFPAISNWLVLVGAVLILGLSLAEFDLDKLVFNIGLAWMGWWLWSEQE